MASPTPRGWEKADSSRLAGIPQSDLVALPHPHAAEVHVPGHGSAHVQKWTRPPENVPAMTDQGDPRGRVASDPGTARPRAGDD
ncbi:MULTISPECIES: hypothetical protein [Mycolicibacterium]|uniref:hypothetical protein n=1 Tax=Mycolicibacterium TaxID=1866885 RepID=UPI0011E4F395|nr:MULTISPECIES: hypothetical protein [Mycolicibacterium]